MHSCGGADGRRQTRRILAIAVVLDGHARLLPALARGIDRQTPRGFRRRANADGVAGLADRPRALRAAARSDGQRAAVAQRMPSGHDRKTDGVGFLADPRDRTAVHFGIRWQEKYRQGAART